jgi:hypothetical membrane protein
MVVVSYSKLAGITLFIGAFGFILAMQVAEFIDGARYNVSTNYVSDLGTYCRTQSTCVNLPSHDLFDLSVFLIGVAIVLAAFFLHKAFHKIALSSLLVLSGVGAMGVGIFPENYPLEHGIFSLIVFLFGGLAAIAAYAIESKPFNYFSVAIGIFSVTMLVLYLSNYYLGLGPGGMERMVAYPELLWGVGLGGHVISWDSRSTRPVANRQAGQ